MGQFVVEMDMAGRGPNERAVCTREESRIEANGRDEGV